MRRQKEESQGIKQEERHERSNGSPSALRGAPALCCALLCCFCYVRSALLCCLQLPRLLPVRSSAPLSSSLFHTSSAAMSKPPAVGDDSMFNPHTGLMEPTSDKLKQLLTHESGNLAHAAAKRGCPFMALQTGMAYRDDDNSLKAGARGPTLLEDQVLREKINHFDHERIPERVVHARGTGAHGYFQVYESLKDITCAKIFQDPKAKTPTFVRFSTVLGSRGSGDTARDVRGFATKFYTEDGNWDLVGNNIPVFFIQDAMKFPDIVHAGKPDPQTEMPQAQTAHDNFWDFCSWSPETMHVLWSARQAANHRAMYQIQRSLSTACQCQIGWAHTVGLVVHACVGRVCLPLPPAGRCLTAASLAAIA